MKIGSYKEGVDLVNLCLENHLFDLEMTMLRARFLKDETLISDTHLRICSVQKLIEGLKFLNTDATSEGKETA